MQRALFAISDLAGSDLDMPEMLKRLHGIVSTAALGHHPQIGLQPDQALESFAHDGVVVDQDNAVHGLTVYGPEPICASAAERPCTIRGCA